jgi:hypothetical protein
MKKLLMSVNKVGIKRFIIHDKEMREVMRFTEPTDVILTRAFLETTTVLQASIFTHASMKVRELDRIIHAMGLQGVHRADILALMPGTERICIKRPRIKRAGDKNTVLDLAEDYADDKIPYDFNMEFDDKGAMCCSELIFWCLSPILTSMDYIERFGFKTYLPDDIFKDNENFKTIYDSGEIIHG